MLKRGRTMIAMLGALVISATALPAMAAAQVPGPSVVDPMAEIVEPGQSVRLSDEKKVTRWAHANETAPVKATASAKARTVARLRYFTEDGVPDVYLVLSGKVDAAGDQWLRIRVMGKPNGRTGWVPIDDLSQLYVVRTQLTISRRAKKATLRKNGRVVWSAPVGVGKASTPTPAGNFWVRELLHGGGGAYGPWAFGTSAYSSIADWKGAPVVGIHGTNEPNLIPGTPSHGCVRLRNNKISQLKSLMPIGTPVKII